MTELPEIEVKKEKTEMVSSKREVGKEKTETEAEGTEVKREKIKVLTIEEVNLINIQETEKAEKEVKGAKEIEVKK